ncbi:unnamed protein product [Somion occarium]|uniref:Ricin B lectin domain-containing protein n=1 Tax=Somion occarium TaxID=3059160 RepID=A0ABP1D735_9APHY
MIVNTLAALAVLSVALSNSAAAAPSAIQGLPPSGSYRIQNLATGLYIDDKDRKQNAGTPVIVQILNNPTTSNQEWRVDIFGGNVATLQSNAGNSGVIVNLSNLLLELNPTMQTEFQIDPAPGGFTICGWPNPGGIGCLTSPSTPVTQIPVQGPTGADNQIWMFHPV